MAILESYFSVLQDCIPTGPHYLWILLGNARASWQVPRDGGG